MDWPEEDKQMLHDLIEDQMHIGKEAELRKGRAYMSNNQEVKAIYGWKNRKMIFNMLS